MIGNDESSSFLTKEELQFVEQKVLRAPDRDLTYATVFPMMRIPNPNADSHHYFIAEDDEGEAELVTSLEKAPSLMVSNNRVTYPVYKEKLKAGLAVEDIEASRAYGTPLNVEVLNRIKRKIDEKANKLAYLGDTKFGVPGVLSGSGYTSITGTDWDTAGLDLANEVISYVNQIPVVYRKLPYTLVLADAEYVKLTSYYNSSAAVGDRSHMERIKSALPGLEIVNESALDSGSVKYDGNTVSAGTALLIPRVEELCRMTIAKAPYVLTENKVVDEMVEMAVAARIGVVETPFPTAIGLITGL